MAVMSPQSKVIAYHAEFQAALLAALKVADKKLFGSIQFRPMPDEGVLQISALNVQSTFVATVPLEMCDVVDSRDEIFECPLSEASVLARFPIKLPPGSEGDDAMAGLIIAESWIQITDETGLGIGIRHARVRRNSEVELPGTPARTIENAVDAPVQPDGMFFPSQLDLAGKVGAIMGQRARLRCIESPRGSFSRVLLTGPTYGLTITEGGGEDKRSAAPDDQPLSFGGKFPDVTVEKLSDTSLRIVKAKPAGGVS